MHGEPTDKEKIRAFLMGVFVGLVLLAVVLFQLPAVQDRVGWRLDFAMTYLRGVVDPVRPLPTAAEANGTEVAGQEVAIGDDIPVQPTRTETVTQTPTTAATGTPEPSATITPTLVPTMTPTPLPDSVLLEAPAYEKQELNNCGPATLAMNLRYFGWEGDQSTISALIKPKREDRNVNVEELAFYAHTQIASTLELQFRVGGDIETLKRFLAAGFPVTVEEAFIMEESYWMNDDRWAGHYLLLTGYDDRTQRFTAQDVFLGPNISIPYEVLDKNWKAFNRVYIVVYKPEQRETVKALMGDHWDVDYNRQRALEQAQGETEVDSTDSYAWFNLGTNLVYFEKYSQAAQAYDQARNHGLPQRMLRYQFGPFFAYFHTGRIDDLLALTEYALKRTPNSEEALLWRGWAMYRQGDKAEALKLFTEALEARPDYPDAKYGLDFVQNN